LKDYKIPMVPWGIYNAAKEMADMESGLKAFKDEAMAAVVRAKLSSGDRRSIGRRYWNAHKDILKSIADEEFMAEHHLTDWVAAQRSSRNNDRRNTRPRKLSACKSGRLWRKHRGTWWIMWATWRCRSGVTTKQGVSGGVCD
jgi:hypothetical protein